MIPEHRLSSLPTAPAALPERRAETVVFVLFLLWLLWLPLPFGSVEGWARAIVHTGAFGLVIWLGAWTVAGRAHPILPAGIVPGFGVIALALLQLWPSAPAFLHTVDAFYTRQATVHLTALVCLFLVSAHLFTAEKRCLWLGRIFIAWGGIFALYAVMQHFIGQGSYAAFRKLLATPFGTFVNRNHYAGFIEMLAPLAVALAMHRRRGTDDDIRWLYVTAAVVMLLSLALCASRGGWIAGTIGVLWTVILGVQSHRRRQVTTGGLLLIPLGVAAGMWWMGIEPLVNRLQPTEDLPATADQVARHVIWKHALTLVRERPLTGSGLGTFQIAYTRVDTANGINRVEQAHNDYLQFLVETGYVGLTLGLIWMGWFFRRARRIRGSAAGSHNPELRLIRIGAFGGCVALFVHGLFDFNWQIPSNAAYFVVLAALATAEGQSTTADHSTVS